MKNKRLFLSVIAFMLCLSGFAQRKQNVVETTIKVHGNHFGGKMTYGYVVNEDGDHVRDGAFSIVSQNANGGYELNNWQYLKRTLNYKLNANYQKGLLHGAMTLSANLKGNARDYANQSSENSIWSFQGNFANGLPHGTFNIAHNVKGKNKSSLTTTYNKGVIVGNMKYSYIEDGYKIQTGNISLNNKGVLHGISTIDGDKMEFINGVLVNETNDKKSTPPSLVTLAKKYANGQITEEELYEQNIFITEEGIDLNKHAHAVIFDDGIIDFERHIERWDFTTPNIKKYKKLEKALLFNDVGVDMLIDQRISKINNPNLNFYDYTYNGEPMREFYVIEDGRVKLEYSSVIKKFVKDPSRFPETNYCEVYLTPSQLEKIKSAVDTELTKSFHKKLSTSCRIFLKQYDI